MKTPSGIFCLLLLCVSLFAAGPKDKPHSAQTRAQVSNTIDSIDKLVLKTPNNARKMAQRTLLCSKRLGYGQGVGQSFYEIGRSYWAQGSIPVSQFYFSLAVPYLKNNKVELANCYSSMARNYVDLRVYDTAHYYYDKALALVGQNIPAKASVYTGLTSLYATSGEYEKCRRFIDTAFKYNRMLRDTQGIAILYSRLGQVYLGQKKLDKAANVLAISYRLAAKTPNTRLLASVLLFQAELALYRRQYRQARLLADKGYDLADEIGSTKFKLRGLFIISGIYVEQRNYEKAFEIERQRLDLRMDADYLATSRSLQMVRDYAALSKKMNQAEVVVKKNRQNETEIKQQHKIIALLLVLLFSAVATVGVIYFFYKQNHKLNTQLQQQHQTLLNQKQLIEMQHTDLESANRVKDKLLAIVGHDLRMPIANLSSIADLFAVGLVNEVEVQKLMTDMVPIVRGAELTLSNLMDFAGNQIKGKKVNTTRFDICAAVNETEEVFRHQLKQKSIAFVNVCNDAFFVNADESQIKVVLRNLISNSIKFTNDRGQITVSLRKDGDNAVICVRDTGVGITAEQAAKIFSYNEHFSEKGTMGEKGTGIGLLLCKELVTLNNGRIWLENEIESGCKVCFTVPSPYPPEGAEGGTV